jgi:TatD DNase family protein
VAQYVDAHCHVDRYPDLRRVLAAAHDADVVTIAVTEVPSSFQKLHAALRGTPSLRLALGLHPLRAATVSALELSLFRRLLDKTDYVGEVGLDFSREGKPTRAAQLKILETILRLPRITEKVLSVHTRGAEAESIDQLSAARATAILHWYSGPLTQLDRALDAGFYFSINPAMLRTKNGQRLTSRIPRNRLLTETDGPYTRVAGRVSEPKDMPWLVERIAAHWHIEPSQARAQIFENMTAVFGKARPA